MPFPVGWALVTRAVCRLRADRERVGSKCPPYFAKNVLRKQNPHRCLRTGIDTHHAVLRRVGIYAHAFRLPLGERNTNSRKVGTRCPRGLPSGRQGTRGQQVPTLLCKERSAKAKFSHLRIGIDTHHAVLRRVGIYAHAFQAAFGGRNTNSRKIGTRCPRGLPLSSRRGTRGQQVPTLLCKERSAKTKFSHLHTRIDTHPTLPYIFRLPPMFGAA